MNLRPTMVKGQELKNHGGSISVWEPSKFPVEFKLNRVYFLHDLDADVTRGHHAHKKLWQLLLVTAGSFNVVAWDRKGNKYIFDLKAFGESLLLPPGFWREFRPLTSDSTLAVFANEEYDESDYIRSLEEFYKWNPND